MSPIPEGQCIILTKEQLKELLSEVVIEALDAQAKSDQWHLERCPVVSGITADQHREDHESIQSLAEVFRKIDGIKWGVLKAIATTLAVGAVLAMLATIGINLKGGN